MSRLALSSHIYFYLFIIIIFFFSSRETNTNTLSPCAQKHLMWQRVFRGEKGVHSTELDIVNGPFCNLCALAVRLALHIFATGC